MAVASAHRIRGGSLTAATAALSVTESKLKVKACSPEVCKFLGIPDPSDRSRSPTALLVSKFIRLHSNRSPGIKDRNWEQNLKILLHGKDRVGLPEVTRLLSPEFTYSTIKSSRDATATYGQIEDNKSKKIAGKAIKK
ncbi:PREDICTED: uncharacterized protein LOC101313763 [Fragaria vesca subsp. vesca]|uniref:uncharacterized protein LOC101313763 n=1 Tax=Fragaria vesca subsp. vesca TaxID=101020 RepID=UPI0002C36046|nr:PREDICTED: uncharacterized protein LOC101313763 [Fragaria vesca subsp. vesca]